VSEPSAADDVRRQGGATRPRPTRARYAAALALGLAGTLLAGVGAGVLALAVERSYPPAWPIAAGAGALVGLLLAFCAVRLARLPPRRALIALLAALLLVPPIAQTVRANVAGATSYAPAKRTTADLRNLGFALESRAVDEGGFPPESSVEALAPLLEGRYIQSVPRLDSWRRPLRYEVEGSGPDARYFLGSAGRDGRWAHSRLADYRDLPGPHGDDIVYSNGGFVALPAQ
jgi:hypothetical protein